jgi:GNAT superfamily N-acetyltransferase
MTNRLPIRMSIFTVEPFARNQGIGSHLLRTIQQWAQSQHVEFLIMRAYRDLFHGAPCLAPKQSSW